MNYDHLINEREAKRHNACNKCAGCSIYMDRLPPEETRIDLAGYFWCGSCAERRLDGIPMWGLGEEIFDVTN